MGLLGAPFAADRDVAGRRRFGNELVAETWGSAASHGGTWVSFTRIAFAALGSWRQASSNCLLVRWLSLLFQSCMREKSWDQFSWRACLHELLLETQRWEGTYVARVESLLGFAVRVDSFFCLALCASWPGTRANREELVNRLLEESHSRKQCNLFNGWPVARRTSRPSTHVQQACHPCTVSIGWTPS